jgi:hypothetical protein
MARDPRDKTPNAPNIMTPVSRTGRILDLAGLVVFLAGGGLVVRAWSGFREVQAFEPGFSDPPMAAVQLADRFWRLEKVGMALMLVGIGVFVVAWWFARHRRLEA